METKIVKISPENLEKSKNDIKLAAEIINSGGLVAIPTETVYGLGGDGTNPSAAKKIYEAKGRPSDNPLIIHIAEPSDAEKYIYTNELYYKLASKFMPGPLTVVMKARDIIPTETRGGLSTVAVRCPSNPSANAIIKESGVPIAAPSANLSGKPSPTTAQHVIEDMTGRIDMIIDGGDCEFGLESTVISIDNDTSVTLLRPGRVTAEELSFIAQVNIASAVTEGLREGEAALSPGMKYRHYAPSSPVVLLDGDFSKIKAYLSDSTEKFALIAYEEDVQSFRDVFPDADVFSIGGREDTASQAHLLFSVLRKTDKKNYDKIYAPLPSRAGIGLALYNRMIRAAAHTIIKL